ncbi:STAS domain-containing protein [Planococcus salinus]|uniref:STAS domain-containing protein n=1 Tax=Planococcus salinus TaxID=1848460 RepID=A0A3M8P4X5_9BACL|nr:STAS domain-containing protein [Planococcus salinus]RNF38705.1 STAS domain-containing protein [Planococcus salinus]
MNLKEPQKAKGFRDFAGAAEHILQMIGKQMDVHTLWIAQNEGQENRLVHVYCAAEETTIEKELLKVLCNLTLHYSHDTLVIPDFSNAQQTLALDTMPEIQEGAFIGVPIYYGNNEIFGTLCGLNRQSFKFTEEHVHLFAMMSSLLTYVLELEKANEQIESLSAPLVPVTKGVFILPVIGEITASRAKAIINHVLNKSQEDTMEYLIIDVSGVSQINSAVGEYLLKLVNILKVIGITPVITGIQPFMALKVPHFAAALKGVLIEANLETALKKLGFVLIQECSEKPGRQ